MYNFKRGRKMSIFSKFYKKEKMLSRTLEINEDLYEKLIFLSDTVYDASINKLVNDFYKKFNN